MDDRTAAVVGLDLGDRRSFMHVIAREDRECLRRGGLPTTRQGLARALGGLPRSLVVLETGTHSPWVAEHIKSLGHEPFLANARDLGLIYRSRRKNDRIDAEKLARVGLMDPPLVRPVRLKHPDAHRHLAVLRARVAVVRSRTRLVNSCRGMVKSLGQRVRSCSTAAFPRWAEDELEGMTRETLAPMIEGIRLLTGVIRQYDRRIDTLCEERYPQTQRLTQVPGVGNLVALSFVLTVGDPGRFGRTRDVGPFFGLVPRQDQSGGRDPDLPITKTGDRLTRMLLVQAAHFIIGPFGPDSDLKRWAQERSERGGQCGRNKTVVAVARRLAKVLLRLWVTGEPYRPLAGTRR